MEKPQNEDSAIAKIKRALPHSEKPAAAEETPRQLFWNLMEEYEIFLRRGQPAPRELVEQMYRAVSEDTSRLYFEREQEKVDQVQERQEKLLNRLINLVKSSPQKAREGYRRLIRTNHKFRKLALVSALMFAAGFAANYERTRYSVTITEDPQTHNKKYEHEDPQTTHLINCLAGLERLTSEEETQLLRELLADKISIETLKSLGVMEETADRTLIEQADREELIALWKKYNAQSDKPVQAVNDDQLVDNTFGIYPFQFDQKYYEALWQMEQENGNPKLEFQYPLPFERSHYQPFTNTIFLEPKKVGSEKDNEGTFVSELSHSKQFNESPISANLRGIQDQGQVLQYMIFGAPGLYEKGLSHEKPEYDAKRYHKIYDRMLYRPPGSPWTNEGGQPVSFYGRAKTIPLTVEYQAHWEIEPDLQARFNELYPKQLIEDFERTKEIQLQAQIFVERVAGQTKLKLAQTEYEAQKKSHNKETEKISQNKKLSSDQRKQMMSEIDSELKPYKDKVDSIKMEYRSRGIIL